MLWHTALTGRLGLRYPIIAAPLGRGSSPEFLAALAREGAMGFVAIGHMPEIPETALRQTLLSFIAATGGTDRFGVNLVLIGPRPSPAETGSDITQVMERRHLTAQTYIKTVQR